jgi:hypothetical protein
MTHCEVLGKTSSKQRSPVAISFVNSKKERHPAVPYKMNSYASLESLLGKTFKNFSGQPMLFLEEKNDR